MQTQRLAHKVIITLSFICHDAFTISSSCKKILNLISSAKSTSCPVAKSRLQLNCAGPFVMVSPALTLESAYPINIFFWASRPLVGKENAGTEEVWGKHEVGKRISSFRLRVWCLLVHGCTLNRTPTNCRHWNLQGRGVWGGGYVCWELPYLDV